MFSLVVSNLVLIKPFRTRNAYVRQLRQSSIEIGVDIRPSFLNYNCFHPRIVKSLP